MSAVNSLTQASTFGVWTTQSSPQSSTNSASQQVLKFYFQRSGEYMQGICRFEDSFGFMMPLFKSLLGLGTSNWLEVTFSPETKTAYFIFPKSEVKSVENKLNAIHELLIRELHFKSVLSQLIVNKKRFQKEQALLNASLGIKQQD